MTVWARLAALAATLTAAAFAVPHSLGEDSVPGRLPGPRPEVHPERPLVESLFDVGGGRVDDALGSLSRLVRRQPDFTLARLVYADLLAVKSGRVDGLGLLSYDAETVGLRHEARARLARYLDAPPAGSAPAQILELPESVDAAILVDLARFRLFLLDNRDGAPVPGADYYVSIGKAGADKRREGDEKTPVGVYRVASYLPGSELPDLYGDGAFPIDYPNPWDLARGRTGSGIWLHGTESERYSRAPLSSRGCVTMSNADFQSLRRRVEVGRTPVVVVDGVDWRSPAELASARGELMAAVESWRRDWESLDTEAYLSHYAPSFRTEGMDRGRFVAYKRRVNQGKRFIRVGLDELSVFAYPGEDGLALVEFEQAYESDTFRSRRRKQQYWSRQPDGWKIVLEAKS